MKRVGPSLIGLAVISGCGRIAFEDSATRMDRVSPAEADGAPPLVTASDGAAGPDDGPDASPSAGDTPDSARGSADAGMTGTSLGPLREVTSQDGSRSRCPALAWNGSRLGIAWWDERDGFAEVYVAALDPDGLRVGGPSRLSFGGGIGGCPSMAWTGRTFIVAWADLRNGNSEIYVALADESAVPVGPEMRITSGGAVSRGPRLASSGSEVGLTFREDRGGTGTIYFARLDAEGRVLGSATAIPSNTTPVLTPDVAWSGASFWVTWRGVLEESYGVFLARLDPSGLVGATDVALAPTLDMFAWPVRVVGRVGSVAVAWPPPSGSAGGVSLVGLDAAGVVLSPAFVVPDTDNVDHVSMAWARSTLGLATCQNLTGQTRTYLYQLEPDGTVTEPALQISTSAFAGSVDAVWTGDSYGVAWDQSTLRNDEELFFRAVRP